MPEPGDSLPRYAARTKAGELLGAQADDFAIIPGPAHAFPPYELVPLAPKRTRLAGWPEAILLDMDGTLTSTEPFCLRALHEVLRLATGHEDDRDWRGLDPKRDYPHLVGNSTSTHVEYVLKTYADRIVPEVFQRHALDAALWGLFNPPSHYFHAHESLKRYGLRGKIRELIPKRLHESSWTSKRVMKIRKEFLDAHADSVPLDSLALRTRAGVDIYYHWWHPALDRLHRLRQPMVDGLTIEFMPGAGPLLALYKGWLGDEAAALAPMLQANLGKTSPKGTVPAERLRRMGRAFAEHPATLAVVTAADWFEADGCLGVAMRNLREAVQEWPMSSKCRRRIRAGLKSMDSTFDAIITASDSTESRLKPHRDLYTLALQRLGIAPEAYDRVLGVEDSRAGITSLRAAGVGLAVAVPHEHSGGQDYSAASVVVKGGLPAILLEHGLFLPEAL